MKCPFWPHSGHVELLGSVGYPWSPWLSFLGVTQYATKPGWTDGRNRPLGGKKTALALFTASRTTTLQRPLTAPLTRPLGNRQPLGRRGVDRFVPCGSLQQGNTTRQGGSPDFKNMRCPERVPQNGPDQRVVRAVIWAGGGHNQHWLARNTELARKHNLLHSNLPPIHAGEAWRPHGPLLHQGHTVDVMQQQHSLQMLRDHSAYRGR